MENSSENNLIIAEFVEEVFDSQEVLVSVLKKFTRLGMMKFNSGKLFLYKENATAIKKAL